MIPWAASLSLDGRKNLCLHRTREVSDSCRFGVCVVRGKTLKPAYGQEVTGTDKSNCHSGAFWVWKGGKGRPCMQGLGRECSSENCKFTVALCDCGEGRG